MICHPPALVGCRGEEGFNKGTMAPASTSVWERAAPPALAPKPNNSDPPHISLVLLELLPLLWSLWQVFASEFVCGPFQRTPGFTAALCLTLVDSPLIFTARCWALVLQAWEPGVRLGPLTPQGTSTAMISSQFLIATRGNGTSPYCVFVWLLLCIFGYRSSV